MELSPEDDLRLGVLLANDVQAIRIDESSRTLYALTGSGEVNVRLNPSGRPDAYLKQVRELLSGQILGSPGGYPIFLRRWTRMGDITSSNLEGLLLLGEPEAVVAVVRSPNLTEELARRAWWAMPDAENARRMLAKPEIARAEIARELAAFLVEFLPFEEDPADAIESIRLVLQPGLIAEKTRQSLWKMGSRKNALRVGFMAGQPDDLPRDAVPHSLHAALNPDLASLTDVDPLASVLLRVLDAPGQAFVETAREVLKKPATQEVVWKLLETLGEYFRAAGAEDSRARDLETVLNHSRANLGECASEKLTEIINAHPEARSITHACLTLGQCSGELVTDIFSRSSAVGSVMRKQIAHITGPLLEQLERLRDN
ncbi:MAG: sulfur reduction protein DsrS [Gammaproteobacteria bacterium]